MESFVEFLAQKGKIERIPCCIVIPSQFKKFT